MGLQEYKVELQRLFELDELPTSYVGIQGAPSTEFSNDFAQLVIKQAKQFVREPSFDYIFQMTANRMAVSFYKYGPVAQAYPSKVDALATLEMKISLYVNGGVVKGLEIAPGNTEYLLDAINYLMIEFMYPKLKETRYKFQAFVTDRANLVGVEENVNRYRVTGVSGYLINAAVFLVLEFLNPENPNAYFKATDNTGSNGRQWNNGAQTDAAHGEKAKNLQTEAFYKGKLGD